MEKAKQLEKRLKVKFKDIRNLEKALIHRSWVNENRKKGLESNERLEFLGDAILEFWTTRNLYHFFPKLPEGSLTNIRAALVRTENLALKSQELEINQALLLGKGEEQAGGGNNPSLLADVLEAVLGAIFLDQGLAGAENFLNRFFLTDLKRLGEKGDIKDAKTLLQEKIQERQKVTPRYQVLKETGPEHNKVFEVGVYVGKRKLATGSGRSKKEAEEVAAGQGLTQYKKQATITH